MRIIDAAYRCLLARDGATVSVTAILAEAGLSTRAFYRHFESKDSLLLALFRRDADQLAADLDGAVAGAASAEDALRRFVQGTLRLTADPRLRQRARIVLSQQARRARGFCAERARFAARQEAAIARILRQGRQDGTFPWARPEADARSVRAALDQAFDDQMSGSAAATAEEAAARIIDFALRALGAASAAPVGSPAAG